MLVMSVVVLRPSTASYRLLQALTASYSLLQPLTARTNTLFFSPSLSLSLPLSPSLSLSLPHKVIGAFDHQAMPFPLLVEKLKPPYANPS
jgi:hypothetical protein